MRTILVILPLLILISCHQSKNTSSPIELDVSKDIVIPKHYIVSKTSEAISIDGKADEPAWQTASFSDLFIDIEGVKVPKFDTKMKMLWDEEFLYVYAHMEEPHIWGDLTQRDAIIYYNNDFEVFIDPCGLGADYGEIEINALNTVWDLMLNKSYRVWGKPNFYWNLNEMKSAVDIHGTLNNPDDIDSLWTVELAIPMAALIELKNKPISMPKDGEQWRINFSRVEWDFDIIDGQYQRKKENGKFLPEYNWVWSNQKVINMHEPEKWGVLQFTEKSSAENVSYNEDPDLLTKQVAYALFRQTRFGSLKALNQKDNGYSQIVKVKYAKDKTIHTTFFKTLFGFEYLIESTVTQQTFIINEEGILKSMS